jgi:hypothetical protein
MFPHLNPTSRGGEKNKNQRKIPGNLEVPGIEKSIRLVSLRWS